MKPGTLTRRFPLWQLASLSFCLFMAAPALAEEALRYAVVSCSNFPLLRDDLLKAPADFFVNGQNTVAADGSPRGVRFVGTVSMDGKQQASLGGRLFAPTTGSLTGLDPSVSFTVKKVAGITPPVFAVDVDLLTTHRRYTSKAGRRYTGSSRVPVRPNVWQEVICWNGATHSIGDGESLSIWQYYTPAEGQAPNDYDPDGEIVPVYRLEILLGQLSNEALDKLPSFDPEHRRLIAELGRWRERFSTHVSPDVPFRLATSFFELKKSPDDNDEAGSVNLITGTMVENPSHCVLKLQYQSPAPRKQDRRVTPLGLEMGTGAWHYQRIQNPPRAEYAVEGAWVDTTWAEKSVGVQCVNIAAYRLTKVSPTPEGNLPQP